MKKILFVIALVIAIGLSASAQLDGFFNRWDDVGNGLDRTPGESIELPSLPGTHGDTSNVVAPLGSGLLVLAALGAGYAMKNRRKE